MLKIPKNSNYCAIIVEIKTLARLPNCDNVQHALIMGNCVVVSNEIKIGDIGLFFPVETQLSKEYLSSNNLYRKSELNSDPTKSGYFEENGRIRCVKFRGHKSEGLFMPYSSIKFTNSGPLNIGDEFDELEGIEICRKYIPKGTKTPGIPGAKKDRVAKKYESKLIDNQFRFHIDTSMFYKNIHKFTPETLVSITYKLHGTSGISSKILTKKPLTRIEKFLKWVGVNIVDTHYDFVNSSRKVIKNPELNPNVNHFYSLDIWGLADKMLRDYLENGMTLYYEIVGFLPNGEYIQKNFDYGYSPKETPFGIYIYRITYTNNSGRVFEFSAKQVQQWCKSRGLNPVPELYYGPISTFSDERKHGDEWQENLLKVLKGLYNDKDCFMCSNKVPEEGIVIRIEGLDIDSYKLKSTRFLEYETKNLDKEELDIETDN